MLRRILLLSSAILFSIVVANGLRKLKPCINGEPKGDRCLCNEGWTGTLCHRTMQCAGFERLQNGSCFECQAGWAGPDCDIIDCHGNGVPNYDLTECTCSVPYSGKYCEIADTKDIYKWYNNFTSSIGPIGILTIIPLALIYMCCEHFAKKRQLRRVEQHLNGVYITSGRKAVDKELVKGLLEASDDEKSVKSVKTVEGEEKEEKDKEGEEVIKMRNSATTSEKKALLADPADL
ncbi:hypothetical protein L5515_006197 [Caenorhabditis briggsae]|uniref:EGF-like domain-containing protein n=1 Tax=Caenorhabditis briggsae TaxID=6238 RepID=A0AAE9F009_CAEBR|nr:hypothetical protein L5515_006197 [Caenorhabditis briggsae]